MSENEETARRIDYRLEEVERAGGQIDVTMAWLLDYKLDVRELCQSAELASVPTLLRVVHAGTQPLLARAPDFQRSAILAAKSLVYLAETRPSRELIPALAVLRLGILSPLGILELIPLRLRLTRALRRLSNLPIPAAPIGTTDNLPIPGESREGVS